MLNEGKLIDEIAKIFNRSVDAIKLKAKRLGVKIPKQCSAKPRGMKVTEATNTTTTSTELPPLKPAQELISLEEMMKKLLGAMELLQDPSSLSTLEIKRCRAIVSTARTYMHMLDKFEQWSHIEQGLVNITAKHLELDKQRLQRTQDPADRAQIGKEIEAAELWLQECAKDYKPFEKKPSLTTTFKA